MTGNDEQGLTEPRSARAEHALHPARRRKRGEARLAPAVAVLVAITLNAVLDRRADHLPVGDRARVGALGQPQPTAADGSQRPDAGGKCSRAGPES